MVVVFQYELKLCNEKKELKTVNPVSHGTAFCLKLSYAPDHVLLHYTVVVLICLALCRQLHRIQRVDFQEKHMIPHHTYMK